MNMRVAPPGSGNGRFVPAHPARPANPVPVWKLFVGDMAKNPMASCAEPGFRNLYGTRRILGVRYHLISDPDGIRHILLDNQPNYVRPWFLPNLLPLLADGLFGADGASWKSQRRLMAPVFTPAAVAEFMPLFAAAAKDAAARWTPGVIDVARTATGLTFDVISRALFSGEHGLAGDEAASLVATALADAGRPKPTTLLGLTWLERMTAGAKSQRIMRDRIAAFVARRQAAADPPPDFITRLIEAFEPEHGRAEAARLVLSNAVTFLVAGHETTANALAWTLYLLSEQPQAQAWAAEEARDALGAGGSPSDVLERLTYLRWVLEEAMRLYPPAPRIERQAAADDRIGPLEIRKGDLVGVWPWIVHRHQALWDDPDAFDPERFAPEARSAQHRFQYIPFGAGPRICIGAHFATAEALLVLAEWLARFEFAPVPGHRVEVASDIALRPKGGLPLVVSRRS